MPRGDPASVGAHGPGIRHVSGWVVTASLPQGTPEPKGLGSSGRLPRARIHTSCGPGATGQSTGALGLGLPLGHLCLEAEWGDLGTWGAVASST